MATRSSGVRRVAAAVEPKTLPSSTAKRPARITNNVSNWLLTDRGDQTITVSAPLNQRTVKALSIPYPPSLNRYYGNWRGRVVLKKEGKEYKKRVAAICGAMTPLTGPVLIELHVYRPRKTGDLDNTFKGILDSLQGFVYKNDRQIVAILAFRHDDKGNPRVEVTCNGIG